MPTSASASRRKRDGKSEFEAPDLRLEIVDRGGDLHEIDAIAFSVDDTLDKSQRPLVRSVDRGAAQSAIFGGDARVGEPRQTCGKQRARGLHFRFFGIEPGYLPIPARKRDLEAGIAEVRRFDAARPGRHDVGDQRAQERAEAIIESLLAGPAIISGEQKSRDEQDDKAPQRRHDEQAHRDRLLAKAKARHPALLACGLRRAARVGWSDQIAETAHRLNHIDAELFAQAADKDLDRIGVAVEILIVEMLDDLGARNHAAGMVHQIGEQAVFVRGEFDRRAVDDDASGFRVEAHRPAGRVRCVAWPGARRNSARKRASTSSM